MRKLTGIFLAAEALWIGLWVGAWEWHPATPWPDMWLRPVTVASAAVFIVMAMNAYFLAKTVDPGENHQRQATHARRLRLLHQSWEMFLQVFAFFLAAEAAFKITDFLHIETEAVPALGFVKSSIEVGSIIGTGGLLIHFFRSLSEARYVIVAVVLVLAGYVLSAAPRRIPFKNYATRECVLMPRRMGASSCDARSH